MYFFKPTLLQKAIFRGCLWSVPSEKKSIYLTFDDGPTPGVTDFVLTELQHYHAQATFFVKGSQVKNNQGLIQEISRGGHSIGNHTYSHLNGWRTDLKKYLNDIQQCNTTLQEFGIETRLFRPPYGRISLKQLKEVNSHYQVVMWTCLSGDFDNNLNIERAKAAIKKVSSGGILVFHDSDKAFSNLRKLLPWTLAYFADLGFQFKRL